MGAPNPLPPFPGLSWPSPGGGGVRTPLPPPPPPRPMTATCHFLLLTLKIQDMVGWGIAFSSHSLLPRLTSEFQSSNAASGVMTSYSFSRLARPCDICQIMSGAFGLLAWVNSLLCNYGIMHVTLSNQHMYTSDGLHQGWPAMARRGGGGRLSLSPHPPSPKLVPADPWGLGGPDPPTPLFHPPSPELEQGWGEGGSRSPLRWLTTNNLS